MNMIETVARALRQGVMDASGEPDSFQSIDEPFDPKELEIARAVLASLRDIPDEIADAPRGLWLWYQSQKQSGWTIGRHNASGGYKLSLTPEEAELEHAPKHVCGRIAWRTMIDACLNSPAT